MADCSKTEVFLKELHRMCDSIVCSECEYGKSTVPCRALVMDNIADSMRIVQKWSDEHPLPKPKTYADDFFEKFPKASRKTGNIPFGCRGNVYGFDCKYYDHEQKFDQMYCVKCWNEPYNESEE